MRSRRAQIRSTRRWFPPSPIAALIATLGAFLALALVTWSGVLSDIMIRRVTVLVLLAIVVYAGAGAGVWAGLASAALAVGYYFGFLLVTGEYLLIGPGDVGRVVLIGIALPSVGVVVGWLRDRVESALEQERRARRIAEREREAAEAARGEAESAGAEAEAARADAESASRRLGDILESITDGFVAVDRDWHYTYVNRTVERLAGKSRSELVGSNMWEVFPELQDTRFEEEYRRAMRRREPAHFQAYYPPFQTWLQVHAYPWADGLSMYFRDVTAHKRAEDELRETAASQAFLAEASSILAASLDYEETLRRVARLAVPELADWCVVDLATNGHIDRVEVAHRDPEAGHVAEGLRRHPPDPNAPAGIPAAIRTGRPELISEADDEWLPTALAAPPETKRIARELGVRSVMIVPLVARQRTLGAITFAAQEGRRYGADDLTFARDLADRAAFAVDNARLYQELAVANQAKSDFLAVMSHELRTPLNAIIGFTDLLDAELAGPLSDEQHRQVDRILDNARGLLDLIDEVLTFSRIEEEREAVHLERSDLTELVRAEAGRVEPLAREKALEFRVRVPDGPVPIDTDPSKLRQLLRNLLSNAVKFTERGGIELSAEIEGDAIVLRIRDTGIGIAPDDLERVFEPFWQAERGPTRTVGGTGLGLSLARRLARLLGGEIRAQSEPGVGSTFEVTLPRRGGGRAVAAGSDRDPGSRRAADPASGRGVDEAAD